MNIHSSISSSDVGRAPHARITAPDRGADSYAPSGYASTSPAQRRASLALAVVCHAAFFGAALYELTKPETFEPPVQGTQISYFDLGAQPPQGDPEGDDAPLQAQPEAPEKVEVETPTPDQAESDADLLEESPIPDEEDIPAEAAAEAAAEEAPQAPHFAAGTGSLALGAKVRGDAGSVDGDLAAAIGVSVATRIRTCWDAPTDGVPDTLAITMSATFDRAGSLVGTPKISRLVDETYMVVTEPDAYEQAAISAVERCSPLQLPPHLFSYWREVDIEIFSARTAEPETAEISEQNSTLRS